MDCKCGGSVQYSEHKNKTAGGTIFTRKCGACNREEKSLDERNWYAPATFWARVSSGGITDLFKQPPKEQQNG